MASKRDCTVELLSILKDQSFEPLVRWVQEDKIKVECGPDTLQRFFGQLNLIDGGSFEDFMDLLKQAGFYLVRSECKSTELVMAHDTLRQSQTLQQWMTLLHLAPKPKMAMKSVTPTTFHEDENREEKVSNSLPEIASQRPDEKQPSENSYEALDESAEGHLIEFPGERNNTPRNMQPKGTLDEYHPYGEKLEPNGIDSRKQFKVEGPDDEMYRRKIWRHQLRHILEKDLFPQIISWTANGTAIHVKDEQRLCREVLGKYLGKSQDWVVFNTQLANHKFRKLYPRDNRRIYIHDFLRRGMGEDMWRQFKLLAEEVNRVPGGYRKRGRPKREPADRSRSQSYEDGRYDNRRRRISNRMSRRQEEWNYERRNPTDNTDNYQIYMLRTIHERIEGLTSSINELNIKVADGNAKIEYLTKRMEPNDSVLLKTENPSEYPLTTSLIESQQMEQNGFTDYRQQEPLTQSRASQRSQTNQSRTSYN